MGIGATVLDILKYTIPAIIVLISSYLIVNNFLIYQTKRQQLAIFKDGQDTTLRLRLQAYERLALFLERIRPRQIIPRVYDPSMTVFDLQQMVTHSINAEFEHNLSQQIYVSKNVWETVKGVKEQELNMWYSVSKTMNPEAPAKELHSRVMGIIQNAEAEDLPVDVALKILNDEASKVLHFGSY